MNNNLINRKNNEKFIFVLFKVFTFLIVLAVFAFFFNSITAYAAIDPIQGINNLKDYIASFFEGIGVIAMFIGGFMAGSSFFTHDASQRIMGFSAFGGGLFIAGLTFVIAKVTGVQ